MPPFLSLIEPNKTNLCHIKVEEIWNERSKTSLDHHKIIWPTDWWCQRAQTMTIQRVLESLGIHKAWGSIWIPMRREFLISRGKWRATVKFIKGWFKQNRIIHIEVKRLSLGLHLLHLREWIGSRTTRQSRSLATSSLTFASKSKFMSSQVWMKKRSTSLRSPLAPSKLSQGLAQVSQINLLRFCKILTMILLWGQKRSTMISSDCQSPEIYKEERQEIRVSTI